MTVHTIRVCGEGAQEITLPPLYRVPTIPLFLRETSRVPLKNVIFFLFFEAKSKQRKNYIKRGTLFDRKK